MFGLNDRSKKKTGEPGMEPVANFLDDDTHAFIASLMEQNAELISRLEQMEVLLLAAQPEAESIRAEAEKKARDEAASIVALAREQATVAGRELISRAQEEAEKIVYRARLKADGEASVIISEAKRRAEEKAEAIRQDAEKLKATLAARSSDVAEKPQVKTSRAAEDPPKKEALAFYDDTVELVISPPLSFDQLRKVHRHLRKYPQIKVLGLGGALDSGIRMKLFLQTRVPLLNILAAIPEVRHVSDKLLEAGKNPPTPHAGKGQAPRIISVTLKS